MRLLVVEDNARLGAFVAKSLRQNGFTVELVGSAEAAEAALADGPFDGVVLDLALPDADGMDILKRLRARRDYTPVLIMTARDGLADRVKGLNSGADDYVVKPFAMDELVARLKALLRRPGGVLGVKLHSGNVVLDTISSTVAVDDRLVPLGHRELAVLELLLRRVGQVVKKQALEDNLYGYGDEVASNAVEVHISRLRRKLADAGARAEIHTVRGVGYFISDFSERLDRD